MKKALMIAYFFPPLGGSGVQRTLKFVKYLPQFGILPVVSTVKSGYNFAYDESLLQEVPKGVNVYRSSSLETLWLREVLDKLASLRSTHESPSEGEIESGKSQVSSELGEKKPEATGQVQEQKSESDQKSLKTRIFEFIDNYLFIPDSKVRWLPFGF